MFGGTWKKGQEKAKKSQETMEARFYRRSFHRRFGPAPLLARGKHPPGVTSKAIKNTLSRATIILIIDRALQRAWAFLLRP